MLYFRDSRTGEHLVTHNGQVRRFTSRAAALAAAHDLRGTLDGDGQNPIGPREATQD